MRVMLAQGHGSIINLFSTFGSRGAPGASMYVASKHAVEGLTKSAALEGAAAGVPAKRLGRREDIAATIVFLASDKADFLTGQIIGVNGGKTAL